MQLRPRPDSNRAALAALALLLPALALAQATPIPNPLPIRPQPVGQPDLVVSNLVLSCPTTSACGSPMFQVGCPNSCTATATITNIGTAPVPANTTHVRWNTVNIYGAPTSEVQGPIPVAIPVGGSVPVSRPYFFGPCNQCNASQLGSFTAIVDPLGTVTESNETNNTRTIPACQVCSGGV